MPTLPGHERPPAHPTEPPGITALGMRAEFLSAAENPVSARKHNAFQELHVEFADSHEPCKLRVHAFLVNDTPYITIIAESGSATVRVQDTAEDMIELRNGVRTEKARKRHKAAKFARGRKAQ
jgi:hypothetical protein